MDRSNSKCAETRRVFGGTRHPGRPRSLRIGALVLAVGLALPSLAMASVALLGRTSVTLGWAPSPTPVSYYDVFVTCANGSSPGAFSPDPDLSLLAGELEVTVGGSYGEACQIRVSSRDDHGHASAASVESPVVVFTAPPAPSHDFDADGASDILVEDDVTGAVYVVPGGSLRSGDQLVLEGSPVNIDLDESWSAIGSGDFNGDGFADFVWRIDAAGDGPMGDVFRAGGASPDAPIVWNFPNSTTELISIGDYDNDGLDDLIFWEQSVGIIFGVFMNPDGTSVISRFSAVASNRWEFVASGDLDGDGHQDLLWRKTTSGQTVAWLFRDRERIETAYSGVLADANWEGQATGNFNNRRTDDLLWRNRVTGATMLWYMDVIESPEAFPLSAQRDDSWDLLATGDVNGDGRDDLTWLNTGSDQIEIWQMDEYATDGHFIY